MGLRARAAEPPGRRGHGGHRRVLAGRRRHDVATAKYDGRQGIYGGNWSGPVFVLTRDPAEMVVHVAPLLLGDGVRLYGGGGESPRVDLERIALEDSGQQVSVRYRVEGTG